jgi:predicted GNAT family acetyltransferase
MENYELRNNKDEKQYEFQIGNYTAKIEYIITNKGDIYLTHTEVPVALERKGIGSQLAEKTLKDIESLELKLVPLCPFIAGYVRKNPEWKKIMKEGVSI